MSFLARLAHRPARWLAPVLTVVLLVGCGGTTTLVGDQRADEPVDESTQPDQRADEPVDESTQPDQPVTDPLAELAFDADDDAYFQVVGDRAYMAGVIGPSMIGALDDLFEDAPDVTTIVMVEVPGSIDDETNVQAARLLRERGIATHVPATGEIASGGVDFFLAGASRSFEPGARFGVHSWSTGADGFNAADLPRDDPDHDLFLDYYADIGVDEAFYWFTLEAAPPESIHWMTPAELERFSFASG